MSKTDKKKKRLQERIEFLENEMRLSLTKKDSSTKEINVAERQSEIIKLKVELLNIV